MSSSSSQVPATSAATSAISPILMALQASVFALGSLFLQNAVSRKKNQAFHETGRLVKLASSGASANKAFANVLETKLLWALSNGLVVARDFQEASSNSSKSTISLPVVAPAPISLEPYKYPASAFNKAVELCKAFNTVVHKISIDPKWLLHTLDQTVASDPFTNRLMDIFKTVHCSDSGRNVQLSSQWCLGIHRSDYMLHEQEGDDRNILQVELNTIASSFGSLSTKVARMQKIFSDSPHKIPTNEAIENICCGIATAHNVFIQEAKSPSYNSSNSNLSTSTSASTPATIVIMVVQDKEKNFSDQCIIQQTLLEKYNIICRRETMAYVNSNAKYTVGQVGSLKGSIMSLHENRVSVVYYRAGYAPCDYLSENEWKARLDIELSLAIKCPTIAYHLAGTKKVQQVLANEGELERFFDCSVYENRLIVDKMRSVFAGLYSLDTTEEGSWTAHQEKIVHTVISKPENYVLKPQREGGNNNSYNEEMVAKLQNWENSEKKKQLSAYILMEKIHAPVQTAILVRNGIPNEVDSICELGIYGIYLGRSFNSEDSGKVKTLELINDYGGYLLRVKPGSADEGGVAAGYSVLSCPYLV